MTTLLTPIIKPDQSGEYSSWTKIIGFGERENGSDTISPITVLASETPQYIYAASSGRLSVLKRRFSNDDLSDSLERLSGNVSDIATVDLILELNLTQASILNEFPEIKELGQEVQGFYYLNIDANSIRHAVDVSNIIEKQSNRVISSSAENVTQDQLFELFLRGEISVAVEMGDYIGQAAESNELVTHPYGFGFSALTEMGPYDAIAVYEVAKTLIDNSNHYAKFKELMWSEQSELDVDMGLDVFLQNSTSILYPMSILVYFRLRFEMSYEDWRRVGDNQKLINHSTLLDGSFEFHNGDDDNIFKLEAVTEFYANYREPFAPLLLDMPGLSVPREPDDEEYIKVEFTEPSGLNAVVLDVNESFADMEVGPSDSILSLDADRVTMQRIFVGHDYIYLDEVPYLIKGKSIQNRIIAIDFGTSAEREGPFEWSIRFRPTIVVVDSFGGRIKGYEAEKIRENTVRINEAEGWSAFERINENFDTIYLDDDSGRKVYRITGRNGLELTLDGDPNFTGNSAWQIPSGVKGKLPSFNITPNHKGLPGIDHEDRGFDHYDGCLFLIDKGRVYSKYRWSSYTSRANKAPAIQGYSEASASSLSGNKRYSFSGYRSGTSGINYSLKVREYRKPIDNDWVYEGGFYFDTPSGDDSVYGDEVPSNGGPGKVWIRLHAVRPNWSYAYSEGCIISTDYFYLRRDLIHIALEENSRISKFNQSDITKLLDLTNRLTRANNEQFYGNEPDNANDEWGNLWRSATRGTLWIIRPDQKYVDRTGGE